MDKRTAREVLKRLEEDLQPLAEKYGLVAEVRGGSFSATGLQPRIELVERNPADGRPETQERVDFRKVAPLRSDLDASDLDREFVTGQGTRYRITGWLRRNRTYPVVCERVPDGKRFKFGANVVKALLRDMDEGHAE